MSRGGEIRDLTAARHQAKLHEFYESAQEQAALPALDAKTNK
jgi:hypothetical protein